MSQQEKYFDTISYFQHVQESMRNKTDIMERLSNQLEAAELNDELFEKLNQLNNELNTEFVKYYTLEEDILFPELEKVLPSPTSTTAIKSEHMQILKFFEKIKEELDKKNKEGINKELVIYTIITFVDIIRRYLHKESDTILREAGSFLSESTREEIYNKILDKVDG